jgi:F-type H+-transporting ATPase subunit delta
MKKHTVKQYAGALYEVSRGASGKALDRIIGAFVDLVRRDRMISKAGQIADAFESISEEREGRSPISVTARAALDARTKKALLAAFGEERTIAEAADAGLLGGFLVRDGDTVYDATLNTRLRNLHTHLTS